MSSLDAVSWFVLLGLNIVVFKHCRKCGKITIKLILVADIGSLLFYVNSLRGGYGLREMSSIKNHIVMSSR